MLQGQLQSYAASVEDDDVRESTARGYGRLVDYVETVSGADRQTISGFFATGMLLNVLAAMEYSIGDDPRESVGRAPGGRLQGNGVAALFFRLVMSDQSLHRYRKDTRGGQR